MHTAAFLPCWEFSEAFFRPTTAEISANPKPSTQAANSRRCLIWRLILPARNQSPNQKKQSRKSELVFFTACLQRVQ